MNASSHEPLSRIYLEVGDDSSRCSLCALLRPYTINAHVVSSCPYFKGLIRALLKGALLGPVYRPLGAVVAYEGASFKEGP